ncbi:MAG: glycosyltransferase [Nostoc sp. TH1S01]|nr:glycosyltransferase [Nostoc sp. TH1S01]
MKQLFIAWVPFQRRPLSMQSYFGYEIEFLSFAFNTRLLRPLEYLLKAWKTLNLFIRQQPHVIWVQLPPTPLLHLAHLYKVFLNQKVIIIADCHNPTFLSPWINFPGTVSLLNRCDLVLIHNHAVKEPAFINGVKNQVLYVLETLPASTEDSKISNQKLFSYPWILCPCSFDQDESIEAILDAARLAPEITFVLTGKVSRAKGIHDLSNVPPNINLVGFLPTAEFNHLLYSTDIVLALTKLEGIQLSVANEAVGFGKPMVLANTKILKELFYKGAIYVNALDPYSIAQGCREAFLKKNELTNEVQELALERKQKWLAQASQIDKALLV